MKIIVFGGLGKMGRAIAENLALDFDVTVADLPPSTTVLPTGVKFIEADLSIRGEFDQLFGDFDLGVCALPSQFGKECVKAAIRTKTNLVDLSFCSENLLEMDDEAKESGVSIIVDAGIAPGLSNLVAGRAMMSCPNAIQIMVGGVAEDKNEPYGYTVSWSLEDLYEEYTRPSRIRWRGNDATQPALEGMEFIGDVAGLGAMEAFFTDGARTLLTNHMEVQTIIEKTLRWPGHIDGILPYLKDKDLFVNHMKEKCDHGKPDVLALVVMADDEKVTSVIRATPDMSAMARSTALSCATFARVLANKVTNKTGILPPEMLSDDYHTYKFVLDEMARHGVLFSTKYPFMIDFRLADESGYIECDNSEKDCGFESPIGKFLFLLMNSHNISAGRIEEMVLQAMIHGGVSTTNTCLAECANKLSKKLSQGFFGLAKPKKQSENQPEEKTDQLMSESEAKRIETILKSRESDADQFAIAKEALQELLSSGRLDPEEINKMKEEVCEEEVRVREENKEKDEE